MSYSYSSSETQTFTVTHARYLATKVATDLKRIQRFYGGSPNDTMIDAYESELITLLKGGYLKEVTYGFQRNGIFIEPTLKYTAAELIQQNFSDDDPGKIRPGADIKDAAFSSFLEYSNKWHSLNSEVKEQIKKDLPFQRSTSATPSISGYYSQDKIYSSGGRSLNRSTLKTY